MKRLLSAICVLAMLSLGVFAQDISYTQPLSQLKHDYDQVRIVAHVKIKNIEFAAPDVHPLYVVRSEVIEPLKGKIKRGQQLEFYFHAEEGFDVNRLAGREWIIFLEGKYPIPSGRKGWYELENSMLPPSTRNIDKMRRIKYSNKGSQKR